MKACCFFNCTCQFFLQFIHCFIRWKVYSIKATPVITSDNINISTVYSTHQVWALGRLSVDMLWDKCMVNSLGPAAPVDPIECDEGAFNGIVISWCSPCKALKPSIGTREEPVTNCNSCALLSSLYWLTICQNHFTTQVSVVQCFSLVLFFQSWMSILPTPLMIS